MKKIINILKEKSDAGSILLLVMVFGSLAFSFIVIGVSSYSIVEYKASVYKANRERAFQIAEAGINYYKWHLAHDPNDLTDGTGGPGPYLHSYKDKDGKEIGFFSLDISTSSVTSTVIVIDSTGWVKDQEQSKRKIRAKISFSYLSNYSMISNSGIWGGNNMTVSGRMHSNSGIRFDGITDAPITSAVTTYLCEPVHGSGCGGDTYKPGIWGQGGPKSLWFFPVPAEDFGGVASSLNMIRTGAQSGGVYLSGSGAYGWSLRFTSSGQVGASIVTKVNCYKGDDIYEDKKNIDVCYDIKPPKGSETLYNMPSNGFIFVEDKVWVEGQIKGKATVGVASGDPIIINNNLAYTTFDGTDQLGLVTDSDVIIPYNSPDYLTLNSAVFAGGAAKRYKYSGSGSKKEKLTIYGSIASNKTWTWNYVSMGGSEVSGYKIVSSTYDNNLLNNPPTGFPRSTNFKLVSWEELK